MDWNALKLFLAISHSGSLSGAATRLGVNHSTVFRRLQSLEREIGGKLFQRLNNRYELTAMGEEVLERAGRIEQAFDDIERHIVGKDIQPKGVVKITAPMNIASRYLPRYLSDFKRDYPDIHIELLASNQALNMNNRQADIAVRATPTPPEHLVGRQVCTIEWSVFASDAYSDQYGLPESLEDGAAHHWVSATEGLRHLPAFEWLDKHYSGQVVARCDEMISMAGLVQAGLGLAILPNDQRRSGIYPIFSGPKVSSKLWVLTHPDLRNTERVKLVMQHLTQALSKECFY